MPSSFRLLLEYDGTDFEGWQAQGLPHRTVQEVLEAAVERVTGERVRVTAAGRTDAGVHAEGQVVSLRLAALMAADKLHRALNGVLPQDVAVRAADAVPDHFDARRDAVSKRYRYALWNDASRSPLRIRRFSFVPTPLDLAAMRAAACCLLGRHDFTAFQTAGSRVASSVRTLIALEVRTGAPGEVFFEVEAGGFLHHMVRILTGTLIEVGQGKREPASMSIVLASRERSRAGPTAPPQGLTLLYVKYPPDFNFDEKTGP